MTPEIIGLLFLVALPMLADVHSTVRGLYRGAREINPFVRKVTDKLGLWPGLLATKVLMLFACAVALNLGAAIYPYAAGGTVLVGLAHAIAALLNYRKA